MRIICCVDLDYFYAQCEEILKPELKNKPVVICMFSGRGKEGGAVATSNYIARKYGVKSGMSILAAKQLLQNIDAFFIPAKLEIYDEISNRIMKIIKNYADNFEKVSIDEAFLEITKKSQEDFNKAVKLMKKMKKEIYEKEKLTCSVGISTSKVIAKIASGLNKPNGLTVIKPEDIPKKIWPLPVEELPYVGPKTKSRMNKIGIKTIGDLAKANFMKLSSIFGRKMAMYYLLASQGKDTEQVKEINEVKQLSKMATLKYNTLNLKEIIPYIDNLSKDLSNELKLSNIYAKGIGLIAILEDLSTLSKSTIVDKPINSYEEIKKVAEILLPELISKSNKLFRRISIKAYNLISISKIKTLEEFLNN